MFDEMADVMPRDVGRRAGRAHKINELEVKRDSVVSPRELAFVFGS